MATYSTAENFKQPVLQWSSHLDLWVLVEDYYFEWPENGTRHRIFIQRGVPYDKASVPYRSTIFRHDGDWEGPSLLHDLGYKHKGQWIPGQFELQELVGDEWIAIATPWTRKKWDWMLTSAGRFAKANWPWLYGFACRYLWPPNWLKGF